MNECVGAYSLRAKLLHAGLTLFPLTYGVAAFAEGERLIGLQAIFLIMAGVNGWMLARVLRSRPVRWTERGLFIGRTATVLSGSVRMQSVSDELILLRFNALYILRVTGSRDALARFLREYFHATHAN